MAWLSFSRIRHYSYSAAAALRRFRIVDRRSQGGAVQCSARRYKSSRELHVHSDTEQLNTASAAALALG